MTINPNTFLNMVETLEIKICAMKIYEGESRAFPHPRSPESLRIIAQNWGRTVGVKAAEAFELIRQVV